jgi:hypothetical protein
MYRNAPLTSQTTTVLEQPELIEREYFFHDLRLACQANTPALLPLLAGLFAVFPTPLEVQGSLAFEARCYPRAADFPVQLPSNLARSSKIRLLTRTLLRTYFDQQGYEYQSYEALPEVNGSVLSALQPAQGRALLQLEPLTTYAGSFLRRYPLLLALGSLIRPYGFEPCHAAAITAPGDARQAALIVGASGSGKTTLSLACAATGCGLLGDDIVLLRHDSEQNMVNACLVNGEVSVRSHTLDLWPQLAGLRNLPADARDKRVCSIEQVRAGATRLRAPVRLLLFPLLSDASTSSVTPLSKVRALQELVEQCISTVENTPAQQAQIFFLLSTLVEQAPAYRLAIAREATDGPELVRQLFTGGAS